LWSNKVLDKSILDFPAHGLPIYLPVSGKAATLQANTKTAERRILLPFRQQ
jgi:hypothetical protein